MVKKKITNAMQEVAVDILEDLYTGHTIEEETHIYDEIVKRYHLKKDFFTSMPCTTKTYIWEKKFKEEHYNE